MPFRHATPINNEPSDGLPTELHLTRLRFLLWGVIVTFVGVAIGLCRVHTNPDNRLSQEEETHIVRAVLEVPRGEIRDCEGRLLAKDQQVDSLYADPRQIADPDAMASMLAGTLGLKEHEVRARLERLDAKGNTKKSVSIKRWLTESESAAIERLDPAMRQGLRTEKEWSRYYPEGELGAHVIGFVNRERYGCEGVEAAFDKYLRCVPGKRKVRADCRRVALDSRTLEYVQEEGGESIQLTIDKVTQRVLEMELDKALERCEAPRGMGMVVNPKTGAILALACRPAYNPNTFWQVPPEQYKNRALVDVFEPGSVFKIVTFSAVLEHGLVTTTSEIDCENGFFNPYGHTIRDYHKLSRVPLSESFAESSNIATIKLAAMLEPERFESWMRRYGFGMKCSDDFTAESRGILRPLSDWSRLSMGALPIGQEISVTMPQLARAFSVIANGGLLVDPYLVERVIARDGSTSYQHQPEQPQRVLSEATAATMRELCHLVVSHGTGAPASIPEYRAGGKTGTAQIARPKADGGGYYPDKYTTIFAGFAPVSDPQVCAVIVVQEPAIRLHYGGYVCGPVFKEVVRDTLIRMKCPPDPMEQDLVFEDLTEDADTVAAREDFEVPAPDMTVPGLLDGLELVALDGEPCLEGPVLPDFKGMTKRQAKEYIGKLGLRWDSQGAGRVVEQEPPAGTPLPNVSLCRLTFSNQPLEHQDVNTQSDTAAARS